MFDRFMGRSRRAVNLAQEETRRFDHSMFERFTERSLQSITLAQEETHRFNRDYIDTEHLLLGLLREGEGVAAQVLTSFNVTLDKAREQVGSMAGYGEGETGDGELPFTLRSKKVLELAWRESLQLGHDYVGTEHLLLGLLRESEGVAVQALSNLNVDRDEIRREILRVLGIDREERRGLRSGLDSLHRVSERVAGRRYALLRGRIEGLHINTRLGEKDGEHDLSQRLLLDLDYTYYALPGTEGASVVDHGALLEGVAVVVEEKRFQVLEEVVRGAGEYVLERFPEVEQVKVTFSGARVSAAQATSEFSVSGTFGR